MAQINLKNPFRKNNRKLNIFLPVGKKALNLVCKKKLEIPM